MVSSKSSQSNGDSEVQEQHTEENEFYESNVEDAVYESEGNGKKRRKKVKLEEVKEAIFIEELKPKRRQKKRETIYEKPVSRKRKKTVVYQPEKKPKKEVLYTFDDEDIIVDSIYEQVESQDEIVYAKGKETNKETTIPKVEKEEHIGRYTDNREDFAFDAKPYHEVYLEEIITEGKPSPQVENQEASGLKKRRKRTNGTKDTEETAVIEDIVFDD